MEPVQQQEEQSQEYHPNMFWGGFFYLTFFIFFNIVLIPYTPKKLSFLTFDGYYPVAMIIYGLAGLFTGMLMFKLLKNAPNWVKLALVSVLYAIILYYLVDNIERFQIPEY
jgi:hypothetical protein